MPYLDRNQILTHRGLESTNPDFYPESSFEAFKDQLARGFGIEFDPNWTLDGIVVWHDSSLKRATEETDVRELSNVTMAEITRKTPTLEEVFALIRQSLSKINALHYKGKYQNHKDLSVLISFLQKNADILPRLLIFDVKPETASQLLKVFPQIQLAPSVAHPYDAERFNNSVANTLLTVDEAEKLLKNRVYGKYPWVWLDEWDLTDKNGRQKKLYTKDVFAKMRAAGAKISLVTPELHGTSPSLYGSESHPDAQTKEKLFSRISEIISLELDAICTDYPEVFANPL